MYTNDTNLPLSLAVFLAYDEYPVTDDKTISVTTLLKPIKQIVLGMRVTKGDKKQDISTNIASAFGTAMHNGIEKAWTSDKLPETLALLGHPPGLIKHIKVNPKDSELKEDDIAVYTEYRTSKEFMGWIISGEFDFVADGRVRDFKTTGTYTYMNNTMVDKYPLQGSMYRWLNPEKITDDVMAIDYIFTDWSGLSAATQGSKGYPSSRMMEQLFKLMSLEDTESFVAEKLRMIDKYLQCEEYEIPACTNEDLWVEPSKFKYYKTASAKRATRVYDTPEEAYAHMRRDGSTGSVIEHKGAVKACKWCPALSNCEQANRYINSGELKL